MDVLKHKKYMSYDYICRYSSVPAYYHSVDDREVMGIGTNMLKDTTYATHKVTQADSLDSLALKYYNNPTLWWVIAYFNDIQDSLIKLSDYYQTLKIPTISNVRFGVLR